MQVATLYYVYDPMCSWCWGFKPLWDRLRAQLEQTYSRDLKIIYVLGGLAPETDQPMEQGMQAYLQQTWQRVSEHTGVRFNFDFWRYNTPRRSTYPACKAVLVARRHGLELAMYEAIQKLYYQQAGNPSEYPALYKLAADLGLDTAQFEKDIHSARLHQELQDEVMLAEQLGAQGLPSLIMQTGADTVFIQHSYTDMDDNLEKIRNCLFI